ncbi:MAG: penicillin-insensitive murein endopeptidase [Pseudomonadota bacterium]
MKKLIPAAVALAFLCPPTRAAADKVKLSYEVQQGDNLTKIAARFNVEIDDLLEWNMKLFEEPEKKEEPPGKKKITEDMFPSVIRAGTKLKIPKKDDNGKVITHKVTSGESFINIARKYGVTKIKLYKWNRDVFSPGDGGDKGQGDHNKKCKGKKGKKSKAMCIDPDLNTIHTGMDMTIYAERPDISPRVGVYRAKDGETADGVAKKFKVKADHVLDFNFLLKSDKLKKNQVVEIPMPLPKKTAESAGSATSGKLLNGERMPWGPGYTLKAPSFVFGTSETITHIVNCIGEVQKEFKGTHDLVVGDLSKQGGGKFKPHKSHASGRDADIGYYHNGFSPNKFVKASAGNLDGPRTMHFISCLADTQKVEYVFVSYYVQKLLYKYLQKQKTAESLLTKLFQYPRPISNRLGLIRHDPGHDNHMHVRFVCPDKHKQCTE